jgi:hypothetical protein
MPDKVRCMHKCTRTPTVFDWMMRYTARIDVSITPAKPRGGKAIGLSPLDLLGAF